MVVTRIPTGCKGLDSLIDNGLPFKSLIHIYGEGGTGKSTLAMQCAKNCVLKDWTVLVLDNERTCSSERLKVICDTKYSEIAKSILVYEPISFSNQADTIESLESFITEKTKLILIDTITTQYRREITEKGEKNVILNKNLNYQLAILKDLAIRFELVVIVTNQVRGAIGRDREGVEPVAGKILNYWADYELQLNFTPDRQMSLRVASIMKHPTNPQKVNVNLQLTDEGIQDVFKS